MNHLIYLRFKKYKVSTFKRRVERTPVTFRPINISDGKKKDNKRPQKNRSNIFTSRVCIDTTVTVFQIQDNQFQIS